MRRIPKFCFGFRISSFEFPAKRARGFTLLEICLVLLLMTVLTALILPHANVLQRHRLQETSRQLQTLAQTAQQESVLRYRHHYILFKKDSIELHQNDQDILAKIRLEKSIRYKIMEYTHRDWREPENVKWWFAPSGIATPMRISFKDQNSWLETSFDPLTMGIVDERYQLN
jgi:type II secretion system protein H